MDLNDEFIEEPDENVEDSSKKCNGIKSGCSQRDVEKSAVKLLASRLAIITHYLSFCFDELFLLTIELLGLNIYLLLPTR